MADIIKIKCRYLVPVDCTKVNFDRIFNINTRDLKMYVYKVIHKLLLLDLKKKVIRNYKKICMAIRSLNLNEIIYSYLKN